MWDMYGLECLLDIGKLQAEHEEWEKKTMWATLKGEQFKDIEPKFPLQYMIMRARMNTQRCYEIYEFMSELPYDDVKLSFEIHPQDIVDFIRKYGHKIYSDRSEKKQVIA